MTSLTKLVSTISVANAAVVFTNWEASSGFSMKLSEAMNQYRDCVSIADDYQLNPSLCSQSNGLEIVTDMANLLDSYDYSVIIIFFRHFDLDSKFTIFEVKILKWKFVVCLKFRIFEILILIFRIQVILHRWLRQAQIQSFSIMTVSLLFLHLTPPILSADDLHTFTLLSYCKLHLVVL